MFTSSPSKKDSLVVMYNFAQSEIKNIGSAAGEVGKVIVQLLDDFRSSYKFEVWHKACACLP